ncbi:hypothetical protein CPC08DRAFT_705672 [Agrocybe pediades]|nr:hypothetical protein CPC08DRAFT_705672 [Agrocybe pediades]
MESIRSQASPTEVGAAIHVPLKILTSPAHLRSSLFRARVPYSTVDVTNIVRSVLAEDSVTDKTAEEEEFKDEVGPGADGRIEIWGLTGWYLSLLMKALRV